jgi:DinB superfamily
MIGAMDRAHLLDRYRTGFDDVADALAGATDADVDRRPAPDAWTAREIAHHLADSETNSYVRLRRLLAEPHPIVHGYDEVTWASALHYDARPVDRSLAVLRAVREANLELLEALDDHEWARQGWHDQAGAYPLSTWLQIYADHSHDHADQIRRARHGRV